MAAVLIFDRMKCSQTIDELPLQRQDMAVREVNTDTVSLMLVHDSVEADERVPKCRSGPHESKTISVAY